MRLVVAMTGASGLPLGVHVLRKLRDLGVETDLIISRWAQAMIETETGGSVAQVRDLADHVHSHGDHAAPMSSGSFRVDGMVIVPCSMKTLAAIRHGYSDNLISRAADVMLKERRRLVLVPREMPLSEIHLENMLGLARVGAVIAPPMPAFYHRPSGLEDVLAHTVVRILDQFGLDVPYGHRWTGGLDRREQAVPVAREGSADGL